MKKLFIIAICLIATTSVFAQKKWYGGPQAGFTISSMAAEEWVDRIGCQVGGFVGYEFTNLFGLELQANYALQGGSNKIWYEGETTKHLLSLHYINLPLLAKFNVVKGFTMYAGPQVGFLVAANHKIDSEKIDIMDECNKTDVGIVFGAGYQFKFGLRLMADYTLGVTKPIKHNSAQNRVFTFKAAWRF